MTLLTVLPVFAADVVMEAPDILLTGVGFDVNVAGLDPQSTAELRLNGEVIATSSDGSIAVFDIVLSDTGTANFDVTQGGHSVVAQALTIIPGWVSLSPPVIAILLAFLLRSVIPALFVGLFVGAWAVNGMTWAGVVSGFFETVSIYIVNTSIDHDHMTIIAFTFLIGGMIGIISKNGGMNGIVNAIMPFASSPRRGQGVIATLGLAIFFDDYSNTMIVGNATRPMSDKLRISREKLAYLVDSTAAPVATVAIITTWIGFQVGLIDSAIEGLEGITATPYVLFLNSIAYSFYPFLALFFVFLIVYTGKDFGPMYHAEIRARKNGEVLK
ncbi:MAG: Na+/H+ antiporter NhaC family protein, partial [Woeseia sp.]|nr:Na+/H+ antiporter NhaC family protein [Woeseia sp.]